MNRESPARRGEKFLPVSGAYEHHPSAQKIVEARRRAVKEYRLKEFDDDTTVMTFRLGRTHHDQIDRVNGDIETQHRMNFFEHIARRLTEQPSGKRFRILLLGSGLGLFNDELRAEFGKKVDVKGISLVNEGTLTEHRGALDRHAKLKTGPFEGNTTGDDRDLEPRRDRVQEILSRGRKGAKDRSAVSSADAKWSSILDLRDYPEFDLLVDTFDELFYSSKDALEDESHRFQMFDWKLRAAIHKLNPGGELYIARLHHDRKHPDRSALAHFWEGIPDLEEREGVQVFIGGVAYDHLLQEAKRVRPSGDLSFVEVLARLEKVSEKERVDGAPDRRTDHRDGRVRLPQLLSSAWCEQAELGALPIKIVKRQEAPLSSKRPVITEQALSRSLPVSSPWQKVKSISRRLIDRLVP